MTATLTKSDEIAEFDRISAEQPADSYLRSIFAQIRGDVAAAIRNDFGFIQFDCWKLEIESATLQNRILAERKQLAELGRELDDKRRQLAQLTKDFETISGDVTTIGRIAAERAATLRRALA